MDVELIAAITGLPLESVDQVPFFKKDKYTMLMNTIKYKYDLSRYTRGFLIASIDDHNVRFTTKV